MRIQESSLQLSSSHEATRFQRLDIETTRDFRTVMQGLGDVREARSDEPRSGRTAPPLEIILIHPRPGNPHVADTLATR